MVEHLIRVLHHVGFFCQQDSACDQQPTEAVISSTTDHDSPEPTSLRVLILDDNRDCADSQAILVRSWDHEVCVAYDGLTALELARIHRPDVALLDICVQGMDGIAVAEHLRRQPESQDTVLIAVTGQTSPEALQRSVACGFARYLLKPTEPVHLRDLLAALLAIRRKERRPSNKGTKKMQRPKGFGTS